MKAFNVLKKNRKYFAATTDGYKCKIVIDENSEALELGETTLVVDDVSVRTKYGTDLIFKLSASAEEQKDAGICTLQHFKYNRILHDKCKKLDGKWDNDTWVFSDIVEDKVEELDEYYNSDILNVEITFNDFLYGARQSVYIQGYEIATAWGRDSGAKMADGVSLISGSVGSNGSMKNWATCISHDAVIRMKMPRAVYQVIADEVELDKDDNEMSYKIKLI